ncbi:MAG: PqqD family protein [Ardenticatenaceae bacterium]|nr:PqqD family protein [Ardenticatenaceae bacterium]
MEKKIPHLQSNLIWRQVDENTVVVTPQSGQMRVLNGVGSVIWQLLTESQSHEAIIDHIVNRYGISPEQAGTDLDKFLAELEERNLLYWGA